MKSDVYGKVIFQSEVISVYAHMKTCDKCHVTKARECFEASQLDEVGLESKGMVIEFKRMGLEKPTRLKKRRSRNLGAAEKRRRREAEDA